MSNAINLYEVTAPAAKRAKRTESQMLESLRGCPLKEATYVLDRVTKLEEKIRELLGGCSAEALTMIRVQRPDLGGE